LTAVVPATNDPPTLARCRAAIDAALSPPEQTVVVTGPSTYGPAAARNAGAHVATGDVLVFVDADVIVHHDAFARIRAAFASDPELTAVFGSYDDDPEDPGTVSGFRNLLHHHVHQTSTGPVVSFWTGLGAVRRDAFLRVGGFDSDRFELRMEDIEFGARLSEAGARIRLDPTLLCTHLKRWTLRNMVHTDIVMRGVPWTRLLLARRSAPATLNLGWRHRLSASSTLAAILFALLGRPRRAASSVAALVTLNMSFYTLLWRRRGARQAVAGVALHAVHHMCGAVALLVGLRAHVTQRSGDEGRTARVIELADKREVARQVTVERPVPEVAGTGPSSERSTSSRRSRTIAASSSSPSANSRPPPLSVTISRMAP
jgi:GT2 family glycosyltransferase